MPPSSQIPGKSGNTGLYLVGMVLLAALMAGLLYWKLRPEPAPPVAPVAASTIESKPVEPAPLHAPPPPPPIEEVADAGADAGKVAATVGGAGKSPCSAKCGDGESSASLNSAINAAASSARGCYNRALRNSEVSGKMMVSVQVASNGSVCSASITNDSVNSSEIASCVLGRFRGRTLPPPRSGCVVVNVPINFTIKQ